MKRPIKRVAAIHDLSGFGRTSLTVVIPILSTMGVQVCPLPTAVLSTITGGFTDMRIVDLTDDMAGFMEHWKSLNLEFDCIYSGFLGSPYQIDLIGKFIDDFSTADNFSVVDPVMGDNGSLYQTMGPEMVEKMRELVKKADIITPNYTEAAFLLNEEYQEKVDENKIKDWLVNLAELGPKTVIITSVPDNKSKKNIVVMAYNREDNRFWKVDCDYIPVHYPGTGDSFTSVIIGSMLQGDTLPIALDRATQFINLAIRASYGHKYPTREGVLLESVLSHLNAPVTVTSYELT